MFLRLQDFDVVSERHIATKMPCLPQQSIIDEAYCPKNGLGVYANQK